MTTVRLPRRIAPPPRPTIVPPIRKSARLAGEVQADATRTISPMSVGASPAEISLEADHRVVVVCTSTPAPKFRKIAKPVSAAAGLGRLAPFGGDGDRDSRYEQRRQQHDVRECETGRGVLREHAGEKRSEREPADVRDRGDDAGAACGGAARAPRQVPAC